MSEDVFVDTSFFKAFIDVKDDFHQQALRILANLEASNKKLVTSNYILDETFTVIRSKCSLNLAKNFKEALEEFETGLVIVRVLAKDEKEAWEYFLNDWKDLSFTDCVSFAMMKRLEVKQAVSFDEHFKRAGFELIK